MKKNTALKAVPRKGQTVSDESFALPIDPIIATAVETGRKELERLNKQLTELVTTAKQIEAAIQQGQSMTIGMLQGELLKAGITNYKDYEYSFEEKVFKKVQ